MRKSRMKEQDITVHEKGYMSGILFSKKNSRQSKPLDLPGELTRPGLGRRTERQSRGERRAKLFGWVKRLISPGDKGVNAGALRAAKARVKEEAAKDAACDGNNLSKLNPGVSAAQSKTAVASRAQEEQPSAEQAQAAPAAVKLKKARLTQAARGLGAKPGESAAKARVKEEAAKEAACNGNDLSKLNPGVSAAQMKTAVASRAQEAQPSAEQAQAAPAAVKLKKARLTQAARGLSAKPGESAATARVKEEAAKDAACDGNDLSKLNPGVSAAQMKTVVASRAQEAQPSAELAQAAPSAVKLKKARLTQAARGLSAKPGESAAKATGLDGTAPRPEEAPGAVVKSHARSLRTKAAHARTPQSPAAHSHALRIKPFKKAYGKNADQWLLDKKPALIAGVALCAALIALCAVFVPRNFEVEQSEVVLNDNGFKVTVNADENTVGELLTSTGVALGEHDRVDLDMDQAIEPGMEIVIRRAMQVRVENGGNQTELFMTTGTVGEALAMAGIDMGEYDEVYPAADEYATPGMTITHIDVEKERITAKEKIGFKEITRENNKMFVGESNLISRGKEGAREVVTEITYKNGVETGRKTIESTVIEEPVNEVVEVGTLTFKKTAMGNVSKSGRLLQTPSVSKIYSKTLSEHKAKPAPDSLIVKNVLRARYVTAYTHTGRRTASGTMPRIGTVACYFKNIPKFTKIYIPGYGYGRIEDQGAGTSTAHLDLDVFMDTEAECRAWGRKRNVKVYILK